MAEDEKRYSNYKKPQEDDFWTLSLHPRQAHRTIAKGLFHWMVTLPLLIGGIWGIYSRDNIAGVLGVSGRRATGQVINETRDLAKGVHSLNRGKGFQPGELRGSDSDDLQGGGR